MARLRKDRMALAASGVYTRMACPGSCCGYASLHVGLDDDEQWLWRASCGVCGLHFRVRLVGELLPVGRRRLVEVTRQ